MNKILILAVSFLLILSCKEGEKAIIEEVKDLAGFTADPQPVEEREVNTLEIGAAAPDFKLIGTDGKYHSLSDYDDAEVLIIMFTCNHCPTAQAYEDRMIQVVNDYKDKGVTMVAISPNSPLGLLYEELGYSDLGDEYHEMVIRHKDMNYNFDYLYDGDDEKVSLQYGPVATPHAFVFDKERKLQYIGRLDAHEKPGTGNAEDLRAAVDNLLAGEAVTNPVTKTFGCSTKWGWKTKWKTQKDKEWAEAPVTIESLDEAGVKNLLANDDSEKLRLVNVWATWCGPCRMEYPEFVNIQRMFGERNFEFVSLSTDRESKKEAALKFLTEKQSVLKNYIYSEEDKYAMIEAVDPDWNGALPYTVLVEPGGKRVWSHQGDVDFLELKKAIVDHQMIGRYF